MGTRFLLPKSEYPKDKAVVQIVPAQTNAVAVTDTNHPDQSKTKAKEKKESILFNTEDIFKARKHELF
jgi:hypothetical protein